MDVDIGPKFEENNGASEEQFKGHAFFLGAAADSWLRCVQLLYLLLLVSGCGAAHICQAVANMSVGWYGGWCYILFGGVTI